jgi:DegV family protein with EDD domain
MRIVTDNASDITNPMAQELGIIKIPFGLTFMDKFYNNNADLPAIELYQLMENHPDQFPVTSLPPVGKFVEVFEKLVSEGQEILSIHMSSGLSGTYNTACMAAEIVRQKYQDAKIFLFDTRTLSVCEGWQVLAAQQMADLGKTYEEIKQHLEAFQHSIKFFYTLDSLKYLIKGGRISHLKGLLAMLMHIRPIITVGDDGKYVEAGKFPTYNRALRGIVALIQQNYDTTRELRFQLVHGDNPSGVESLTALLREHFKCSFGPALQGDNAAGAHVGPSIVGVAVGYADEVTVTL